MFRFGDPTIPRGTSSGRLIQASLASDRPINQGSGVRTATTNNAPGMNRFNPVHDRLDEGAVYERWLPRDIIGLNRLWRIIYARDDVAGPMVDFYRELPWSDYRLSGVDDTSKLRLYEDAFNALGGAEFMSDITGEFLCIGRAIATMIFDESKGYWSGVSFQDPDYVRITPVPIYNADPKVDVQVTQAMHQFAHSRDPRDTDLLKSLPDYVVRMMKGGRQYMPVDPLNCIFLPRKSTPYDAIGCVVGSTNVNTNKGLIPIREVPHVFESQDADDVLDGAERLVELEDCWVPGHGGTHKAAYWVDKGKQPVMRMRTKYGYTETGTLDHPVLVMAPDNTTDYKQLSEVKRGDFVAINRTDDCFPDELRLDPPPVHNLPRGKMFRHDLPTKMTPSLARVLGYLVAEGSVGETCIQFGNTDPELNEDFYRSFRRAFPDYYPEGSGAQERDEREHGAYICESSRENDLRCFNIVRQEVVGFFHYLGLNPGKAKDKRVPWSVMRSSRRCVAAFLSAYFEGDGSVREDEVMAISRSGVLIRQLQVLLLKFGIVCRRYREYLGGGELPSGGIYQGGWFHKLFMWAKESDTFAAQIGFRSVRSEERSETQRADVRKSKTDCIPYMRRNIRRLLKGRKTTNEKHCAGWYYNDKGRRVRARLNVGMSDGFSSTSLPDNLLEIKKVSKKLWRRLNAIVSDGYYWDEVVYIKEQKKRRRVYDLVVPETKSFTANGIINHNTSLFTRIVKAIALEKPLFDAMAVGARRRAGGITHLTVGTDQWEPDESELKAVVDSFISADEDPIGAIVATRTGVEASRLDSNQSIWKLSDEIDMLTSMKMRALGISDALLSGDASFNTMEMALTVFLDRVRALREYVTRRVAVRKVFNTLAKAHEFYVRKQADLAHGVRTGVGMIEAQAVSRSVILGGDPTMPVPQSPGAYAPVKMLDDTPSLPGTDVDERLDIPDIIWAKSLQPQYDDTYISILERLEEKGIKIPLRKWAAAGGQDLDSLIGGYDNDIEYRKQIATYTDKMERELSGEDDEPAEGAEGEDNFGFEEDAGEDGEGAAAEEGAETTPKRTKKKPAHKKPAPKKDKGDEAERGEEEEAFEGFGLSEASTHNERYASARNIQMAAPFLWRSGRFVELELAQFQQILSKVKDMIDAEALTDEHLNDMLRLAVKNDAKVGLAKFVLQHLGVYSRWDVPHTVLLDISKWCAEGGLTPPQESSVASLVLRNMHSIAVGEPVPWRNMSSGSSGRSMLCGN